MVLVTASLLACCYRLYQWRAVLRWVATNGRVTERWQSRGGVSRSKSTRSTWLCVWILRTSSRCHVSSRHAVRGSVEIRRMQVKLIWQVLLTMMMMMMMMMTTTIWAFPDSLSLHFFLDAYTWQAVVFYRF